MARRKSNDTGGDATVSLFLLVATLIVFLTVISSVTFSNLAASSRLFLAWAARVFVRRSVQLAAKSYITDPLPVLSALSVRGRLGFVVRRNFATRALFQCLFALRPEQTYL